MKINHEGCMAHGRMTEKVFYAELLPEEFAERIKQMPVAYLPLGTLEWHGAHLPLGSDGIQAQGFFERLAKKIGGIVLPMLFMGPEPARFADEINGVYGMDILGYQNINQSPQQLTGSAYYMNEKLFVSLLEAIVLQLARAGFKVLVAHGHGPSTDVVKRMASEWGERFNLKIMHCHRENEDEFGIQTDHAGMNETSLVMALRPELVCMESLDPNPEVKPLAILGKDPRFNASPEHGEKAIEMQLEIMSGRIKEALL